MQEEIKTCLREAGVDVEGALERLMGSEALLERFLKKFPADPNYAGLVSAVERGDHEAALTAAHTLKGMCGNLSMTALFDLLTRQVALFPAEDWAGAAGLMPEISAAYARVTGAIGQL